MVKRYVLLSLLFLCFLIWFILSNEQHIAINDIVDNTNFWVNEECAGTLIDLKERLIITNYHCIEDKVGITSNDKNITTFTYKEVMVSQGNYKGSTDSQYITKIIASDKEMDLALLQINQPINSKFAASLLPEGSVLIRGQPIWIVGNPLGWYSTLVKGNISSVKNITNMTWTHTPNSVITFAGGTAPGTSGGALYDEDGYFIAIPFAEIGHINYMGVAIPVDEIRKFLKENHHA